MYLIRMSAYLISKNRTGLDPRISIIPVGGVTNMPVFVALFCRRLDVRALVDGAETNKVIDKIYGAADAAKVDRSKIVILGKMGSGLPSTADIEDLLTTKDYLWLYNRAVPSPVGELLETDLPTIKEPILRRIEQVRGKFDHAGPAHRLTQDLSVFFAQADAETLDRFEELFNKINA